MEKDHFCPQTSEKYSIKFYIHNLYILSFLTNILNLLDIDLDLESDTLLKDISKKRIYLSCRVNLEGTSI